MAGNLSGGEQQMLALGGALMTEPRAADDRRAVARPGADDRRPAARGRARDPPARHDDRDRRAVGQRRAATSPSGPCSWRRARCASRARPPSCSSGPTSCARCSSPAPTRRTPTDDGRQPDDRSKAAGDGSERAIAEDARSCSSASGVVKRFGGITAVDDVDLAAARRARSSASSATTAPARPR